jgi:hypothetical protein
MSPTTPADTAFRMWLRIVAFCAIGAALFVAVDRLLWFGLRRARANTFAVWNAVIRGDIGSEILVVGGSRALVGYDCAILSARLSMSCFNIGLDGTRANLQRPYVETYLLHNKPPRLAIVNADVGSLTESVEPYDLMQYIPYLDERPLSDGLARYVDVWKYRYIPLYAFSQRGLNQTMIALGGISGGHRRDPDRFGSQGLRAMDGPWDNAFEEYVAENPDGILVPIDPVGVADFERIITMLQARDAEVVIAFSPEWAPVRRLELNRQQVIHQYVALAAAHHAVFLDYSDSAPSGNQSLFYNSQHLNRHGAKVFTTILASDLVDVATGER